MEYDRLSVKIPKDQMAHLETILPWGLRSTVVRGLLGAFERGFEEHGLTLAGAIIAGQVQLRITGSGVDISELEEEEEDDGPAAA